MVELVGSALTDCVYIWAPLSSIMLHAKLQNDRVADLWERHIAQCNTGCHHERGREHRRTHQRVWRDRQESAPFHFGKITNRCKHTRTFARFRPLVRTLYYMTFAITLLQTQLAASALSRFRMFRDDLDTVAESCVM